MQQRSAALQDYLDEERRIKNEIYNALTGLGGLDIIIDIGCGESTSSLLLAARSSFVVCIDVEPSVPGTRSREDLRLYKLMPVTCH